jgi:5'-nucleotidase (lipoprotein e(P4) family)
MLFMKYGLLLPAFLLIISCNTTKQARVTPQPGQLLIDGKLWSSIFQQRAAEYKALCIQAFNIARMRIDEILKERAQQPGIRKLAIITDIDETFLDNSPNSVHQALLGKDYEPAAWAEWTSKGIADTLPGALSFFNYAASKNIEIFYITNRDQNDKAGTLANLQRFHFPFADNEHLMVRGETSSKELAKEQTQKLLIAMLDVRF